MVFNVEVQGLGGSRCQQTVTNRYMYVCVCMYVCMYACLRHGCIRFCEAATLCYRRLLRLLLGSWGLLRFWLILRLMDKILHDPKDPKLWELWHIP